MGEQRSSSDQIAFWSAKGFHENPFEYTNADQEELLESYFIDPPYFASVMGDPNTPIPAAIFAPRGGGKTAQRIMVERRTPHNVLTITYTDFPSAPKDSYDLQYHLVNIIRHTLIGLLTHINREGQHTINSLDSTTLRRLACIYLAELYLQSLLSM